MATSVKMNTRVEVLPENHYHGHICLSVHLVTAELGDHLEEPGDQLNDSSPQF